jgi:hypothetical protein
LLNTNKGRTSHVLEEDAVFRVEAFVYEVHPRIVVKVPKSGDFEREQFQRELKIYKIFYLMRRLVDTIVKH